MKGSRDMKIRKILPLGLFLSIWTLSGWSALAATPKYPERTVTIVVPFPAGGGADVMARLIADKLGKLWHQAVIVENRSGAAGLVGAEFVVRSAADGYTMLFSPSPVFSSVKSLYKNLSFDPDKDLKPVTLVARAPNVLMVRKELPVHDVADLLRYAKQHPEAATYASQGVGTTGHLTGAYFAQAAHVDMRHVPYRGAAPAMNDLLAGVVTMDWDGLSSALGMIQSGNVRALAVAGSKRAAALPDVPTMIESGFPNFESFTWYGIAVPSATPDGLVQLIYKAVSSSLHEADVARILTQSGAEVIASTPQEMADYVRTDSARWKEVIEKAHIELTSY